TTDSPVALSTVVLLLLLPILLLDLPIVIPAVRGLVSQFTVVNPHVRSTVACGSLVKGTEGCSDEQPGVSAGPSPPSPQISPQAALVAVTPATGRASASDMICGPPLAPGDLPDNSATDNGLAAGELKVEIITAD